MDKKYEGLYVIDLGNSIKFGQSGDIVRRLKELRPDKVLRVYCIKNKKTLESHLIEKYRLHRTTIISTKREYVTKNCDLLNYIDNLGSFLGEKIVNNEKLVSWLNSQYRFNKEIEKSYSYPNRKVEKQQSVMYLRSKGLTYAEISKHLGISRQRCWQIWQRRIMEKNPIVAPSNRMVVSDAQKKDIIGGLEQKTPLIDRFSNGEEGIFKPVRKNYK